MTVNSNVGSLIDLYNIKFFGLGTSTYSTYSTLFVTSDATSSTAVSQITKAGISASKIIIGKSIATSDSGYISAASLVSYIQQAN